MRKIILLLLCFSLFLLLFLYLPYSSPTFAQNCSSSYSSRVQEGLISSPQISAGSKLGTTSGACITDPKAAFAPYKVPSYNNLKSLYFTQAKSSIRKAQIAGSPSQGDFTSKFTQNDVVLVNGDLPDVNYTGTTKPSLVFVEGDLSISNDITYGDANSGLVFIVKGNVNIFQNVTRVDAIIISEGTTICTAYDGTSCPSANVISSPFVINGSLISIYQDPDPTNPDPNAHICPVFCPLKFRRSLNNNSLPAEKINHQVKYLVILRNLLSDTYQRWSEVTGN